MQQIELDERMHTAAMWGVLGQMGTGKLYSEWHTIAIGENTSGLKQR
jgi:hypothetical protein